MGNIVKVKNINWISKEDKEAEVYITDGVYTVKGFSHPCYLNLGQELSQPLLTLDCKIIGKVEDSMEEVVEIREPFSHLVIARVLDTAKGIVSIGQIKLEVDNLPGDLVSNDLIELLIERIDL
jgi:hypothetical protein